MSDHGLRKAMAGAALALALMAPLSASAQDCAPLSAGFELCANGTPWAEARWIQFGDGAAIEMGPYYLEFAEHWAGRNDDSTLDGALDTLLAVMLEHELEEGMDPPETMLRDAFETDALSVVRVVQSIDMGDDTPLLMATMIAEGAGDGPRIAVMFSHDDVVTLDRLNQKTQDFVALIRPAQEG